MRTDLKRFRSITEGHVVIMGRKTLESIGRPLPNRTNIVLTRRAELRNSDHVWIEGETCFVSSADEALFVGDFISVLKGNQQLFVIGGAEIFDIYQQRLQKIYLTDIYSDNIHGDAFFKFEYDKKKWKLIDETDYPATDFDQYPSRFSVYEKKDKYVESVDLSKFMTDNSITQEWLGAHQAMREAFQNNLIKQIVEVPEPEQLILA